MPDEAFRVQLSDTTYEAARRGESVLSGLRPVSVKVIISVRKPNDRPSLWFSMDLETWPKAPYLKKPISVLWLTVSPGCTRLFCSSRSSCRTTLKLHDSRSTVDHTWYYGYNQQGVQQFQPAADIVSGTHDLTV